VAGLGVTIEVDPLPVDLRTEVAARVDPVHPEMRPAGALVEALRRAPAAAGRTDGDRRRNLVAAVTIGAPADGSFTKRNDASRIPAANVNKRKRFT
jgi:hypothetical protein